MVVNEVPAHAPTEDLLANTAAVWAAAFCALRAVIVADHHTVLHHTII